LGSELTLLEKSRAEANEEAACWKINALGLLPSTVVPILDPLVENASLRGFSVPAVLSPTLKSGTEAKQFSFIST